MVNYVTKSCSTCNKVKSLDFFYLDKTRGTVRPVCKQCTSKRGLLWRTTNKARKAEKDREYRLKNTSEIKTYQKDYYIKNKLAYTIRAAKRKAARLKATPEWLSREQLLEIEYIYFLRQDVSLLSDYDYHVDHIVPLQGINVCGLHVPWNLQLLQKEVNYAKSNRF